MTEPAPVDLGAGDGQTPDAEALARLAADVLPGYVLRRRWYAAKDAGAPRVRPVASDPLPTDAGTALLAVFEMTPPGRPAQLYFLPLMTVAADALTPDDPAVIAGGGDERLLIDAFATDAFVRALVAAVRGEDGAGAVRFARTAAFAAVEGALDGAPEVRRSAVEQSNSSARVGGAVMLKCFRKLDPGTHPELEMGRHLTAAGFANTPDLLGWIERGDGRDGGLTLAVLQSLVENEGDGWAHTLDGLRDDSRTDPAAFADRLGRRTAELHRVLAAPTDDPAFRPEPVGPDDLAAWRASIHDLASRAMAGLERSPAGREGEAARLLARRDEVGRRIDALCPDTAEAARTRLHGDYHLGQVLVAADGDAVIIDFEGEPMRPLAERRAKHSPLRDVAGMLRSFAYAGAAVARDAAPGDGGAASGRGPSEAAADLAGAFLDRYRAAVEGCPSLPADPADAARLLRLFLLEKALYEVGYEIANRPDWLAIPVAGVLALLDDPEPSDAWPRPATLAGGAPRSALDRLAERVGIETAFENAAGETVRPSDATKRALLKALGVEAASDDAAAAALERIERAERLSPLPPAAVGVAGRPVELTLALPEGTGEVAWTIRREDGGDERGAVAFADLALIDAGEADGMRIERRRWRLDHGLPPGYHRLGIEAGGVAADASLITAPPRCYLPPAIEAGGRVWGIALQLHLLRSAGNWGLGDFGDLARLAALAEDWGSTVIGLNPVHAMFPDNPEHTSPYSPASRLFLNVLYIDVTAVPGFADCAPARAVIEGEGAERLRACREADLVDFAGVARLKLAALEHLFANFRRSDEPARTEAFARFRREAGEPLERLCLFYALRERFGADGPEAADWRRWPDAYRDVTSPKVEAFAAERAERIAFHAWTQWLADEQLGAAARAARAAEGAVGLYRDLAVGADGSGAEPWCDPKLVAASARVGAPPDLYMPGGQDWGLPPLNPAELRRDAYKGFIALVRANMRHAGALRIDHAMALLHVYWIPEGNPPTEGSYVAYPFEDLLGILALESVRHGCLVIGEDLGTVPRGFRERMTDAAILSYRVLFFEQDEKGAFTPPEAYPELALSTIGNHDLATLRGWWEARDIDLKARHGLYPDGEEAKQRALREEQRAAFLKALRAAGVGLPEGFDTSSAFAGDLALAAHAFLARTRSALALVQLDDLTDEADQVNLPGTTDAYPNWRRKLARSLEELGRDPEAARLTTLLARERGGAPGDGAPAPARSAAPA